MKKFYLLVIMMTSILWLAPAFAETEEGKEEPVADMTADPSPAVQSATAIKETFDDPAGDEPVIDEDKNRNGLLDPGEDLNGNGVLDTHEEPDTALEESETGEATEEEGADEELL